jgi:hypothetical protein
MGGRFTLEQVDELSGIGTFRQTQVVSPPQMDEVFGKFKGLKGKFPGFWIIISISNHIRYLILIPLYHWCQ